MNYINDKSFHKKDRLCACPRDYRPLCCQGKQYNNKCLAKCSLTTNLREIGCEMGACKWQQE